MEIKAEWDTKFGEREKSTNAIFLMAGSACLGYVDESRGRYMACAGVGMEAPVVYSGTDLTSAKSAVERWYGN